MWWFVYVWCHRATTRHSPMWTSPGKKEQSSVPDHWSQFSQADRCWWEEPPAPKQTQVIVARHYEVFWGQKLGVTKTFHLRCTLPGPLRVRSAFGGIQKSWAGPCHQPPHISSSVLGHTARALKKSHLCSGHRMKSKGRYMCHKAHCA